MTRQTIRIAPNAPMVFVLDRSASMATRDCPEGMSRWDYARGALRQAIKHAIRQGRRVTLITVGRGVSVIDDATHVDVDDLLMGDNACWLGQAASEALWFAAPNDKRPGGGVVIIADGMPEQDTRVGQVFLSSNVVMRELFSRTVFLTVGKVPMDVQLFASLWPHYGTLEQALAGSETQYGGDPIGAFEAPGLHIVGDECANAEVTRGAGDLSACRQDTSTPTRAHASENVHPRRDNA